MYPRLLSESATQLPISYIITFFHFAFNCNTENFIVCFQINKCYSKYQLNISFLTSLNSFPSHISCQCLLIHISCNIFYVGFLNIGIAPYFPSRYCLSNFASLRTDTTKLQKRLYESEITILLKIPWQFCMIPLQCPSI